MDANYIFDEAAADRVCRFFETQLHHYKGRWAGQTFKLLPWQKNILRDVFGWKRPDGTRRYRFIYTEIGRKNGKSFFASGIALYLLCADGEQGAEIYSAACNTGQSGITFEDARNMIEATPQIKKRIKRFRYHFEHPATKSIYKVLSGEAIGSHGKNIHGLILDEAHEFTSMSSRQLYTALTTSMGARTQPLTVVITTAGNAGDESLCLNSTKRQRSISRAKLGQTIQSMTILFTPSYLPPMPKTTGPTPKYGRRLTPAWAKLSQKVFMKPNAGRPKKTHPPKTLRRLYLCQWTEQTTRWLDLAAYDQCTAEAQPIETPTFTILGLDLSIVHDFSAAVTIYAGEKWIVQPRLYIPKSTAVKRWREHGTPIPLWIEQGFVIGTDGLTVDYDRIEQDILDAAKKTPIAEVAFDPYNAAGITRHLEERGLTTVPVYQTWPIISPACKEIERRLIEQSIIFPVNPALRWMAAAAEVESDRHDNIRLAKPNRKGKYAGTPKFSVDGIMATLIAASRVRLRDPQQTVTDIDSLISFVG